MTVHRVVPKTAGSPKQRRGPLKMITKIVIPVTCRFERNLVELECQHRVYSRGRFQARCDQCLLTAKSA